MSKIKSYIISIMTDRRKTADAVIVRVFLSAISIGYLILQRWVYFFYRMNILKPHRVAAKVISIGNITLGGTGKTPFAIKIARDIKAMGRRPAVLTRGYGNDESQLLSEALKDIPVLIGKNRVNNSEKALSNFGSDCIILDDGFQHYSLERDIDIVLLDSTSPIESMRLFPRGTLREPLGRLKDADIVILTKSDMGHGNIDGIRNSLKQIRDTIEIAESFYQPVCLKKLATGETIPLSYIKGREVALLTGIANPDYFSWIVENLGAKTGEGFYFPDHHPYSVRDIESILKRCTDKGIVAIITTEKDAVRLRRLKDIPQEADIFVLQIDFRISANEKAVVDKLDSVLRESSGSKNEQSSEVSDIKSRPLKKPERSWLGFFRRPCTHIRVDLE